MAAEQMTHEYLLDDLIQAAWQVIASDFDESVFQKWRRKALSCALSLCGPDHSATQYFMERISSTPRSGSILGAPVPFPDLLKSFQFVASLEDENRWGRSEKSLPPHRGDDEQRGGRTKSFEGGSTQACARAFARRLRGTWDSRYGYPTVDDDKKSCCPHHQVTLEGNGTRTES